MSNSFVNSINLSFLAHKIASFTMGNAVATQPGANGERMIGVEEAKALLGPNLWKPYEEEFNDLQPPVALEVFADHATKVLNNLVQTGRVSWRS